MEHKLNKNSIESYHKAENLCRFDCINYIEGIVKEVESKRINLWLDESDWYPICSYDEGNHTEYSEILSVYIGENGELSADLEDCELCPVKSMATEDIVRLADYFDEYLDELLRENGSLA